LLQDLLGIAEQFRVIEPGRNVAYGTTDVPGTEIEQPGGVQNTPGAVPVANTAFDERRALWIGNPFRERSFGARSIVGMYEAKAVFADQLFRGHTRPGTLPPS
jgi:hypothetical protein